MPPPNNERTNTAFRDEICNYRDLWGRMCRSSAASLSAASFFLFFCLPYAFIYPVMWVPVHRRPKSSGSLEHLALMEKGFCRRQWREPKLRLDVGQWNVAAVWQQDSLQGTFKYMQEEIIPPGANTLSIHCSKSYVAPSERWLQPYKTTTPTCSGALRQLRDGLMDCVISPRWLSSRDMQASINLRLR